MLNYEIDHNSAEKATLTCFENYNSDTYILQCKTTRCFLNTSLWKVVYKYDIIGIMVILLNDA